MAETTENGYRQFRPFGESVETRGDNILKQYSLNLDFDLTEQIERFANINNMKLVAVGILNGKKTTVEYTQNQGEEKILFDGKEDSIMECEILIHLDLLHSGDGISRTRMSAENVHHVFSCYVFDGGYNGLISIECDTPLKEAPYDAGFIKAGGKY